MHTFEKTEPFVLRAPVPSSDTQSGFNGYTELLKSSSERGGISANSSVAGMSSKTNSFYFGKVYEVPEYLICIGMLYH